MALNPTLRAGLSNSQLPSSFSNVTNRSNAVGRNNAQNPDSRISSKINSNGPVPSLQFPEDLPKYRFQILENEWAVASRQLTLEKYYTLPIPSSPIDSFSIEYDTSHELFPVGRLAGSIGGAAPDILASGQAALGRTINTFKTVTLQAPQFREYTFTWKLSPKNQTEARNIQAMIWSLRKGMTPSTQGYGLVFRFPKIYMMYFWPNVQYLYKMKPAVLKAISANYAGGNPHPTFYKSSTGNGNDSPPESVIVSMQFLELEYWIREDYKDTNGLPTTDPFDVTNYYNTTGPNVAADALATATAALNSIIAVARAAGSLVDPRVLRALNALNPPG